MTFRSIINTNIATAIAALILIGILACSTAYSIHAQRERTLQDAKRELSNLSLVLAEQTDRAFQSLELVQSSLMERIDRTGARTSEELARAVSNSEMHQILREKISGLPQIDAVTLIDANGKLLNFSRYWPIPDVNVSDRDYFRKLASTPELRRFVSEPVQNRGTGTWTIYNARKLTAPDGAFLGLVLGAVELKYFETFFQSISLGNESAINLFREDGTLLARYPTVTNSIGKSVGSTFVFSTMLKSGDAGVAEQMSLIDGRNRLIAARRVTHFPLVITVSDTIDSVLSQWLIDSKTLTVLAAIVGASLILCALLIRKLFMNAEALAAGRELQVKYDKEKELAALEIERLRDVECANHKLNQQYALIREHERALGTQNRRFEAALQNMSQGLAMFDKHENLVVCNQRYLALYGLSEKIRPGVHYHDVLAERARAGSYGGDPQKFVKARLEKIHAGEAYDTVLELSTGTIVSISHRPMEDGGWVSTHEDVTARKRAEDRIVHMARHDALTDLPNRLMFREELHSELHRSASSEIAAVLCLDLDQFKAVNDTLGHPVGDLLLKAVANKLSDLLGPRDLVARLGGDEFAILQRGEAQPAGAGDLARNVVESLSAPFDLGEHQVVIGTSVGVAMCHRDGSDADSLIKNADLALYRAKAEGRGRFRFFEAQMDAKMQARRRLELDLRRAVRAQEFALHYQPLVGLENFHVTGFEALVRWERPDHGRVSPAEFIPLAEEIGLIVEIGEWVVRQACHDAAKWPEHIKVAVNLSPVQFRSRNLVNSISEALTESGLAPSRLELEITESVLLQDDATNLSILHELRNLGIRISLDDFGTGYSSLSYLRSFPFDKIKIDQSFVRELSNREDCAAIVRAVAGLGATLGMATTAEGVETFEQLEHIRAEGCTEVQGYFFSAPRPVCEVLDLIETIAAPTRLRKAS